MTLETGTFVNDLVITNPPGTDAILQGDDHIRLIKNVLKATFPNADKAFYLPDAITKTAAYTVVKADIDKFFQGDATTAAFSFTLPTLAAADDGWYAVFIKSDASANAVTLVGTINGAANLILDTQYEWAIVYWTGTAWLALIVPASTAATTTQQLTGTSTSVFSTPDSVAALWEKGADKASAATVSFDEGGYVHITGTTTITDLDFTTAKDGRGVKVVFDGVLTLTHNGTTLILPGAANIVTAAGDTAEFIQDSGDNIKCLWYTRAANAPGGANKGDVQTFLSSGTWNKPLGFDSTCVVLIQCWGAGGSGGKGSAGAAQGGGGGGGYNELYTTLGALGATETVTIGAGGAAQTVANTAGNAGGNTTFGAHLTAYGGGAGGFLAGGGGGGGGGGGFAGIGGNSSGGNAGLGGSGGGGNGGASTGNGGGGLTLGGGGGGGAAVDATGNNGVGGDALYAGGGGGAGAEDAAPGPGAGSISLFGGAGGAGAFDASNATEGAQPGGGGGGSEVGNSGAGGAGKCVVNVF